jgi:hypothetical protein
MDMALNLVPASPSNEELTSGFYKALDEGCNIKLERDYCSGFFCSCGR